MTGKYLITTDAYFFAPDGKQYRAVWGEVQILPDTFLGVQTNRNSSNWFARVGSEEQHVILAGCQIHYAVKVDQCPNPQDVQERVGDNHEMKIIDSRIYVPVEADIPEPPVVVLEGQIPGGSKVLGQVIRVGDSDAVLSIKIMLEKIKRLMSDSIKNRDQFNDLLSEVSQDALKNLSSLMIFNRADTLHVNIYAACGGIKRQFHFSLS